MNFNNKGFAATTVLLVILVLGIVGAVGYMLTQQDTNNKKANVNHSSVSKDKTATATSDKSPNDKKGNYLLVKELNVSIPLDASLKDVTYEYESIDNGDGTQSPSAYLYSPRFHELFEQCGNGGTGNGPSFAAIVNNRGVIPLTQEGSARAVKQFNGFWIAIDYPNGLGCAKDDQNLYTKISTTKNELQSHIVNAIKNAEQL